MNKFLMTGVLFVVSKLLQGVNIHQGTSEQITKLKLAEVYLYAVKTARLLLISLVASGACLMFLMMGLMLVHYIVLAYMPWPDMVKVIVTLICAVSYIALAAGIFRYVFAEDRWMKMCNAEAMIKDLTGK